MNIYFWIPVGIIFVIFFILMLWKNRKQSPGSQADGSADDLTILTDNTFEDAISNGITLIDFWATWCSPCKVLAPVIEELAKEYKGRVKVCKLDVDENGKTAREMKIRGIPTIIIFQDGVIVGHFVGVKPKSVYTEALKKLF